MVSGSRARRGAGDTLSFWAKALTVGAGVARGRSLLPNLRSSPPPTTARSSRSSPPVSRPLVLSVAFLPLSLCVSSLALRSLPYFSSLCGCLSLHLRLHFFLCLTLSLAVPRSLLRSLFAFCSFSLPLFVWLSLLSLPSAVPPPHLHTSQPCLRCPQGWQVGGAAAETG